MLGEGGMGVAVMDFVRWRKAHLCFFDRWPQQPPVLPWDPPWATVFLACSSVEALPQQFPRRPCRTSPLRSEEWVALARSKPRVRVLARHNRQLYEADVYHVA